MGFCATVTLIASALVLGGLARQLPPKIEKCDMEDQNLSDCVFNALNSLRPGYVENTIKELNKLPTLDPFVVPRFDLVQDSPMANYTVTTWNFTIHGLKSFDIKKIRYDSQTMTFHADVEFYPIDYDTGYNMKGHLVSIPIDGKGTMRADLGALKATVEIPGEIIKQKNADRYTPTGIKIRILIDDLSLYFDGLFGGNAELARVTNQALNINSRLIALAVTPVYEIIAETAFKKPVQLLANAILDY